MNYCLEGDFVQYSESYGRIDGNSKLFDDSKELGGTEDSFLNYLIKNIKIYTGKKSKKEIIIGIQMTYQNIKTKEIKELPLTINNKKHLINEDFKIVEVLPGEYLTNFYIRYTNEAEYIYQLGFETNKKRKIMIGTENGEDKKIRTNNKGNIILGTFGYFSQRLDSFGILYVNLKDYLTKFYIGYFELKLKLKKDEIFRKENEKKFQSFSESDQFILKACTLPDGAFFEIIKFCIF
jgi:hypothetical protein